jgi:AraC family transcriptional regulator
MKHYPALQDLCARIFREPERMIAVSRVPVAPSLTIAAHKHTDLLQIDFSRGCAGKYVVNNRDVPLKGNTVAAFYPFVTHGYAFKAARPGAEVTSLKLRVARNWPAIRQRIFAPFVRGVAGEEPIAKLLRRLSQLAETQGARPPLFAATLCELLCLWPGLPTDAVALNGQIPDEIEPSIKAALDAIDEQLSNPPSIEELAAIAHLSPRHFNRRVRNLLGCSPHDYITGRRLTRARELLAQGQLNITAVAETLGFPSVHTFSRWFQREAHVAPTTFRQRPTLL